MGVKVELAQESVLLIRTLHGQCLGAFFSHRLRPQDESYGNGSCFVFTLLPEIAVFEANLRIGRGYIYSTPKLLAVGGGRGYAIQLGPELTHGTCSPSETFGLLHSLLAVPSVSSSSSSASQPVRRRPSDLDDDLFDIDTLEIIGFYH
eukprot:TRINITY_DN8888_c0_g1_i2.p1 TRINITY_DN8888_c0_g1~~TRINITY_DN8888_c0_g1_i2.p1  ORF type:complete len:157 (+),score=37.60 TRINITY_DN8888_c0_g1_i2:29-472(+)